MSSLSEVGKQYFRTLVNPQAASEQGYIGKYPDKYADKTFSWFSHIDLGSFPYITRYDDLAGTNVIPDVGNGTMSYYITPDLINPLKVLQVVDSEVTHIITGTCYQQSNYTGLFSNSSESPSVSTRTGLMQITSEPQQIAVYYQNTSVNEANVVRQYPYCMNLGDNWHMGYPARFNSVAVSFTAISGASLSETRKGKDKTLATTITVNVYSSAGLEATGSGSVAIGFNEIVAVPTSSPAGVAKLPGNRVEIVSGADTIFISDLTLRINLAAAPQLAYLGYPIQGFDALYTDVDRYRVVAMSSLLTDLSPALTASGNTTSNLIRGGEPPTFNNIASPSYVSQTDGGYTGKLKEGNYVWWRPYDSEDMNFRPKMDVESIRPYIVNSSKFTISANADVPNTYRLRVYINYEATTHIQSRGPKASPVDLQALVVATQMIQKLSCCINMPNDAHDVAFQWATLPIDISDYGITKFMSSFNNMPPIVKDLVPILGAFL
jgi:hypothetical protein